MRSSLRALASDLEHPSRIGKAGWGQTLSISVGMLNETVHTQQEQLQQLTDPVQSLVGCLSQGPGHKSWHWKYPRSEAHAVLNHQSRVHPLSSKDRPDFS